MSSRTGLIACLVLCAIGAWLTGALYGVHVSGAKGGLLGRVCGGEGGGCDKVVNSRWSMLPPRSASATPAEGAETAAAADATPSRGIPVAAVGLFYFSALGIWFATVGFPGRRWMMQAIMAMCGLGVLISVCYIFIMGALVKAWCPLCLGSHAVNFLLLGAVVFLRPARQSGAAESPVSRKPQAKRKPAQPAPAPRAAAPSPSPRLALVATALAASVCFAEWQAFSAVGLRRSNARLDAVLGQFMNNLDLIEAAHMNLPIVEIDIRDDDPIIEASGGTRMTVVVFADVECEFCAAYDKFLRHTIMPMFDGHLRIVFKHFPDPEQHPNALRASTAVEAARIQGKFWEMYDLLVERHDDLGAVNYETLARDLGLDVQKFTQDMDSIPVKRRIDEDYQQGRRAGVTSTPTVFLNKRLLDPLVRELPGFWKLRRDGLERVREARGEAW